MYAPLSNEFFFPKHFFHHSIPNSKIITIVAATTIPTTVPADMLAGEESA